MHLSNCTHNELDIRDENGELPSCMLQCNSTLRTLILSDNPIYKSDEASKFIAEGLKHNTALEKLDLKDCTLDAEAAKHITEALIVNRHLTYFLTCAIKAWFTLAVTSKQFPASKNLVYVDVE